MSHEGEGRDRQMATVGSMAKVAKFVAQYLLECWDPETPSLELTSLFGAEAGDRTRPLGALWGRREVVQEAMLNT